MVSLEISELGLLILQTPTSRKVAREEQEAVNEEEAVLAVKLLKSLILSYLNNRFSRKLPDSPGNK